MSKIYDLIHNKNDRSMLNAAPTYISESGAQERLSLYLSEDLVEDDRSHKYLSRYRLHAMQPHNIEMALAYDIYCPKCGHRLKQIGRCRNSHELGLYACPEYDRRKRGN